MVIFGHFSSLTDGQKIAKRLSLRIQKASSILVKAVADYDDKDKYKLPSHSLPNTISIEDAYDVKSIMWSNPFPNSYTAVTSVPAYMPTYSSSSITT